MIASVLHNTFTTILTSFNPLTPLLRLTFSLCRVYALSILPNSCVGRWFQWKANHPLWYSVSVRTCAVIQAAWEYASPPKTAKEYNWSFFCMLIIIWLPRELCEWIDCHEHHNIMRVRYVRGCCRGKYQLLELVWFLNYCYLYHHRCQQRVTFRAIMVTFLHMCHTQKSKDHREGYYWKGLPMYMAQTNLLYNNTHIHVPLLDNYVHVHMFNPKSRRLTAEHVVHIY